MPDLGVLLPVVLAVAMVGVCVLLTLSIVRARRLSAQLDNKVARMEALLRQADDKIQALGRAEDLSRTGTAVPAGSGQSRGTPASAHTGTAVPAGSGQSRGTPASAHTGTAVPAGSGQSRGTPGSARTSTTVPDGSGQSRGTEPRHHDPVTVAVYEHADAGRTPIEIATELDEQVGKVELILALRDRGPVAQRHTGH